MKKSMLAALVISATGLLALAGCSETKTEENGKVLNVMCWNTEFQERFEDYYPDVTITGEGTGKTYTLKNGVKVKFIVEPNDNNNYQNKLDEKLKGQDKAAADDKVDMFLIEADYATKYTKTAYTLDLKTDIGLTTEDLADQYKYTQDIVTYDGHLKATSWQATPGLFAYRRDIAKSVLGTDDPARVQEKISDWAKFNEVAAQMKTANVKMLSGFADNYRPYSNNMTDKWVTADNTIRLDPEIKKWIVNTKDYADKKYIDDAPLWSAQWQADQGPDGHVLKNDKGEVTATGKKTFGFFYSTWGINFTLAGNADPDGYAKKMNEAKNADGSIDTTKTLYGDYAVCKGPAPWYWGGSWLCAAKGTDNKEEVKDIMKKLTCDATIAEKITRGTQDYTNNKTAMNKLASDASYGSEFLGGQNHIALFKESAEKIDMSNAGPHDQTLNEGIQNSFEAYFFNEKTTYANALAAFKKTVAEKANNLKFSSEWDSWDGKTL